MSGTDFHVIVLNMYFVGMLKIIIIILESIRAENIEKRRGLSRVS